MGMPVRQFTKDEIQAENAVFQAQAVEPVKKRTLAPLPKSTATIVGGRAKWKQAWVDLLQEKGASHAVTFAFNNPISVDGARQRFGEFLQHLDRVLLGPRYAKMPDKRTFAVAFAENITSNIHLHAVFAVAPKHQERFLSDADEIWKKLFPGGDVNIKAIDDLAGAVDYMTKHTSHTSVFDSQILSTEFQRSASA